MIKPLKERVLESIGTLDDLKKAWEEQGIEVAVFEYPDKKQLRLQSLIISMEMRKAGHGSAAMTDLTRFADATGQVITLQTGERDPYHGTTSKVRLKKFYKRFGFVENTGRNTDFTLSDNMYRKPQ